MALAHTLEFPGKLRLDKETYIAVQSIYYPGFTFGGLGEGLGMVALLLLLLLTPRGTPAFWWTLGALIALLAMHATYWIVTHPVNKFWLKDQQLGRVVAGFFALHPRSRNAPRVASEDVWVGSRDRWEYSHILRALLAAFSFIALTIAIAL